MNPQPSNQITGTWVGRDRWSRNVLSRDDLFFVWYQKESCYSQVNIGLFTKSAYFSAYMYIKNVKLNTKRLLEAATKLELVGTCKHRTDELRYSIWLVRFGIACMQ